MAHQTPSPISVHNAEKHDPPHTHTHTHTHRTVPWSLRRTRESLMRAKRVTQVSPPPCVAPCPHCPMRTGIATRGFRGGASRGSKSRSTQNLDPKCARVCCVSECVCVRACACMCVCLCV
jgi:hypothetical protein